jgi:hypothetical protein
MFAKGPDDFPDGPTYTSALKAFSRLMAGGNMERDKDDKQIQVILEKYLRHLEVKVRASTFGRQRHLLRPFSQTYGGLSIAQLTHFKPVGLRHPHDGAHALPRRPRAHHGQVPPPLLRVLYLPYPEPRAEADDRPCFAGQDEERCLEGVLGVLDMARNPQTQSPDHRPMPSFQGREGSFVPKGDEPPQQLAVGQVAVRWCKRPLKVVENLVQTGRHVGTSLLVGHQHRPARR